MKGFFLVLISRKAIANGKDIIIFSQQKESKDVVSV